MIDNLNNLFKINNLNSLLGEIEEKNLEWEGIIDYKIKKSLKNINHDLKKFARKQKNMFFFVKDKLKEYSSKYYNNYFIEILKLQELKYFKNIETVINKSIIFDFSLITNYEELKDYLLFKILLYHFEFNNNSKNIKNNDKLEDEFYMINKFITDNEDTILKLFDLKNAKITDNLSFANNFYSYKNKYLSIIDSIEYLEIDDKLKELNNFLKSDFSIDDILNNNVTHFLKNKFEKDKTNEYSELKIQREKYSLIFKNIDKIFQKLQDYRSNLYIINDKVYKLKLKKYFLEKEKKENIKCKNNNLNFDNIESVEKELKILDNKLLDLNIKKNNKVDNYKNQTCKITLLKKKEKNENIIGKIKKKLETNNYKFIEKFKLKINQHKEIIEDINKKLKIIGINDDINKNLNKNINNDISEQIIKVEKEREQLLNNKKILIEENTNFYEDFTNIKNNIDNIFKTINTLELEKKQNINLINIIESNLRKNKKDLEKVINIIYNYENKIYLPDNNLGLNLKNINNYVKYLTNSEIYRRKQAQLLLEEYSIHNFTENIYKTIETVNNIDLVNKENINNNILFDKKNQEKFKELYSSILHIFYECIDDIEKYKKNIIYINIINNFNNFLNIDYQKNINIKTNYFNENKEDLRNIINNNNIYCYNNTSNIIKGFISKSEILLNTSLFKSIISVNKNLNNQFEKYNKLISKKKFIENNNFIIQKFKEEINIINNIFNNNLLNNKKLLNG